MLPISDTIDSSADKILTKNMQEEKILIIFLNPDWIYWLHQIFIDDLNLKKVS